MDLLPNCTRLLAAAAAACGLVLAHAPASAQLLEFTGAELRGRIDRPTDQNVWTLGDTNGNGIVDDTEQFATRVDVDHTFLNEPGSRHISVGSDPLFGAVTINFDDPQNLMFGFIDVVGGVGGGPFAPDGVADDINMSGQFGPDGFDLEDPGREPDTIIVGVVPDFDDLVRLPAAYDYIGQNSFARFGGAHLMHVLRFEGEPEFTLSTTNETLELGYGARFYSGYQDWRLYGTGGVMGETHINSSMDSQAIGPQVSVRWALRHGRWHARAEASAAITYMNLDGDQFTQIGQDLVAGQYNRLAGLYNRPLYLTAMRSESHMNEWDLSPAFEAGLLASYDITPSTFCFARCDAIQFGNVRNVEDAIIYELPRMGLRDPGGYDLTITSASVGVEMRR